MGYQNVSDVVLCCILSDLTSRSCSGLALQCAVYSCRDDPLHEELRSQGDKTAAIPTWQARGLGHPRATKNSCQSYGPKLLELLESQSCVFPTKCINSNQGLHGSQLSESQALNGPDVVYEVWGFVMGDFNGFNTQIYAFSSNYKGQIYVMFCSGLILIPLLWDRFAVEDNTSTRRCLQEKGLGV